MIALLKIIAVACVVELALALFLTFLPRFPGWPGRTLRDACTRAPGLDAVIALLTWIPWVAGAVVAGWAGFGGVLAGQVIAMVIWIEGHELVHREAARGPRLIKQHHRLIGRWRNQAALWFTVVVLPLFWMIRLAQVLWIPVRRLTGFPPYRQADWINVSRHKFEGLIGHDLIWCLYCDWMTGVYALGAEMLRNVESFWCPIRFYDGKKCDNCRVDFPDLDAGWVAADGTMADVEVTMQRQYGGGRREWFGHPARLTVDGKAVSE